MYRVVLVECNDSNRVKTYGSYRTLEDACKAADEFNKDQKEFKQGLNYEQLMCFVEEMPIVVKDYEKCMSVQWLMAHRNDYIRID